MILVRGERVDNLTAVTLGIVQGLTEFLPVSSSGHLVLAQRFFGLTAPQILFDIVLHLGTLAAVLLFVRKELGALVKTAFSPVWLNPVKAWEVDPDFRMMILIILACVPTALIGLLFKDWLVGLFASTRAVGWALMATGTILVLTRFVPLGGPRRSLPGAWGAAIMGLAQGMAIIPGLSRSGTTIAAGLFLGLGREAAARFSFLLFVPAIFGALILELSSQSGEKLMAAPAAAGFFSALAAGYLALLILVKILTRGRFHYFAPYCWLAGIITLVVV